MYRKFDWRVRWVENTFNGSWLQLNKKTKRILVHHKFLLACVEEQFSSNVLSEDLWALKSVWNPCLLIESQRFVQKSRVQFRLNYGFCCVFFPQCFLALQLCSDTSYCKVCSYLSVNGGDQKDPLTKLRRCQSFLCECSNHCSSAKAMSHQRHSGVDIAVMLHFADAKLHRKIFGIVDVPHYCAAHSWKLKRTSLHLEAYLTNCEIYYSRSFW